MKLISVITHIFDISLKFEKNILNICLIKIYISNNLESSPSYMNTLCIKCIFV